MKLKKSKEWKNRRKKKLFQLNEKMGTRVGGIVVISLAFLAKISIGKSFPKLIK